jgi:exonuclease SbcC
MLEERKIYLGQLQDLKVENSTLRADAQQSREGLESTEKEFRRLQDKHRELLVSTQELKEERDRFHVEAKTAEEKLRVVEKTTHKTQDGWERERADLEARMAGLIKQVDRLKSDPTTSREGALKMQAKINEYKQKVKLAN